MPAEAPFAVAVLTWNEIELLSWPVGGGARPDIGTVEALAQAQLWARRIGCRVRLRAASPELTSLIGLAGLSEVLVSAPPSG